MKKTEKILRWIVFLPIAIIALLIPAAVFIPFLTNVGIIVPNAQPQNVGAGIAVVSILLLIGGYFSVISMCKLLPVPNKPALRGILLTSIFFCVLFGIMALFAHRGDKDPLIWFIGSVAITLNAWLLYRKVKDPKELEPAEYSEPIKKNPADTLDSEVGDPETDLNS